MFPGIFLCSKGPDGTSRKKDKKTNPVDQEIEDSINCQNFFYTVPFDRDPLPKPARRFTLRSDNTFRSREVKHKEKREMANKVSSNFSDLIQRVTASCLLHPLAVGRQAQENGVGAEGEEVYEYGTDDEYEEPEEVEAEAEKGRANVAYNSKGEMLAMERVLEMEMLMNEVFDSVSAMKRAYGSLQEAHCPWDPARMRIADVAVLGELKRLSVLRERFRRCMSVGGYWDGVKGRGGGGMGLLRELVAPYEAVVEELKREVKGKEAEVLNLKEKLKNSASLSGGKKGWSHSKRKVSCSSAAQVAISPSSELFEATMNQVRNTSKSFTSLLLTLMRTAHWDIAAAVRSIEAATAATDNITTTAIASTIATHHAKYALESYISRKIFQGFDHETFYMDGSLSSLLNPDQFRRDCFTQYRDMKAMDPCELLGILPTCHFGKFCSKKYLAIVHPKMEESLFGNVEQHQQVLAGSHPRTQFYSEFLGLAKAIWLLHLLAFSLDPAPSQFDASRGAEYHPQYMESVVKFSSGRIPAGQVVGFPVSPGFRLGNGSVVKARVYLVPRN